MANYVYQQNVHCSIFLNLPTLNVCIRIHKIPYIRDSTATPNIIMLNDSQGVTSIYTEAVRQLPPLTNGISSCIA